MPYNQKYKNQDGYSWDTLRSNLRMLMKSHGMTGKDFANAVGLAPTPITRYLTERSPDLTSIWRIADYWGVSIDWLLGRETSNYAELPETAKKFINAYSVASDTDKESNFTATHFLSPLIAQRII